MSVRSQRSLTVRRCPVKDPEPGPEREQPEPLWREAVGRELRGERTRADRTLADVAGEAGVSTQYLSEIERGLKEPISVVLGAVAGALGLRLVDLTTRVSQSLVTDFGPSSPLLLAA